MLKINEIKDKEAKLVAILAIRRCPESSNCVLKAVEAKSALSKYNDKRDKILEPLQTKKDRVIAAKLIEEIVSSIDLLLSFDPEVHAYLKTSKKHTKILQKRFNTILEGKSETEETRFVNLLDKLDTLAEKIQSLGIDSKSLIKLELESFSLKQEMKQVIENTSEELINLSFMKEYLNGNN